MLIQVSYIKALDWYLIFSFLFVLGSVLEYVTVIMRADIRNWRKKRGSTDLNTVELAPVKQVCTLVSFASDLNIRYLS